MPIAAKQYDEELIKELHAQYMAKPETSLRDIGNILGIDNTTVSKLFKARGLPVKSKGNQAGTDRNAEKITLACENCNETFEMLKSEYKTRTNIRFCSWACYRDYYKNNNNKTIVVCANCGKEFTWYQRNNVIRTCCSVRCSREYRLNGYSKWRDKDHISQYNRNYQKDNKESIRMVAQKWEEENKEKVLAIKHKYRANNRDKLNKWNAERSKIIHNSDFTGQDWTEIKEKYNYTCLKCGKREPEIKLTVDHIIPIAKGGKNTKDNIQPLCSNCNSSKGIKETDYRLNDSN